MHEIVINENLFAAFCKHLSANLNVVDVIYKLRQLAGNHDLNRDDPVMLAVFRPEMITRLVELKYPEFILACIKNFRLLDNCRDVFCSEIETDMVNLFADVLERVTQTVWIENVEQGFIVHTPGVISDLIMAPIGRVHNELLQSLDHFTKILNVLDNDPGRLFLHAKSPTPESQYVQIWVAAKLGIPLAQSVGVMGVI